MPKGSDGRPRAVVFGHSHDPDQHGVAAAGTAFCRPQTMLRATSATTGAALVPVPPPVIHPAAVAAA